MVGGRYELRAPVGNGGMGTVWRSTDTLLRRDVAVKEVILPPTMPTNEKDALCERTLREARAAAALSHPSVVQVYDVVTDAGRPWIVMELLDARSLADMVIDDGPQPLHTVAKIGIAMLGALEVAHAAGVLHRDVKPANVLICTDGRCVLTDFGVARLPTESNLTTPGMVLGSPHFISPERAVGGPFGPPSDLFSLGVTLYTAIEGGPPFDRGDPFETMRAVVEEEPRPTRLAGPLQPVLWGLLDKEPTRRWSVDQARGALRELLSGTPGQAAAAQSETDLYAVARPLAGTPRPTAAAAGSVGAGPAATAPAATAPAATVPAAGGPLVAVARSGRGGHSRVGGRAMLAPGESLTSHLARLDSRGGTDSARPHESPVSPVPPMAWSGPLPLPETDEWQPPQTPPDGMASHRRSDPSETGLASQVAERVKVLGRKAGQPHNRVRLAIVCALVVVLALAAVATLSGWFTDGTDAAPPPGTASSARSDSVDTGLTEIQQFADRGISVNVPKGWTRSSSGSYVDFIDPGSDSARKIRINIEDYSGSADKLLQNAESRLQRPGVCPTPYRRAALIDTQLAGLAGAQLEYTCGTGSAMRHGIWDAVVVDGKAYHFYLTVPDSQFADSKVIFMEMVRSFRFVQT